jgi:molybdate transport system substrate-binding protein
MSLRPFVAIVALGAAIACGSTTPPAAAPPLRVFSSNGVRALLEDLRPELEQAAGRPLTFEFSTTTGLQRRIEGGDVPDVAVFTTAAVDGLSERGILAPDSRRPLAQVGVGVGVRADAPDADVSTTEALKAFLIGARSVTYTAEGQSRAAIDAAFERFGIVDAMAAKTALRGPGEPPGAVAKGESDVVITLVSEMVEVPGLKVLGPLPPELQRYVSFAAARRASTGNAAAADRLLQVLASVDAARLAKHGLEPAPAR